MKRKGTKGHFKSGPRGHMSSSSFLSPLFLTPLSLLVSPIPVLNPPQPFNPKPFPFLRPFTITSLHCSFLFNHRVTLGHKKYRDKWSHVPLRVGNMHHAREKEREKQRERETEGEDQKRQRNGKKKYPIKKKKKREDKRKSKRRKGSKKGKRRRQADRAGR